jgi:sulfate adenylyltransferase
MSVFMKDNSSILRCPTLTRPHGGRLVRLMATEDERRELMKEAAGLSSLQISATSTAHLFMLACGAFSPLDRFVSKREYESIVQTMRLTTGELCPMPVTLPAADARNMETGSRVALRDAQNRLLAIMTIEEAFDILHAEPRLSRSGRNATKDRAWYERAFSGPLQVFHLPADLQFPDMWRDPAAIREELSRLGHDSVVAVDYWNSNDAKETEWLRGLASERDASLLLNLADAEQRVDALDHFQRMRECRKAYSRAFSATQSLLNFVHLDPALPSERQILWHAMVHKNYGASSYVIDSSRCNSDRYKSESDGPVDPSQLLSDGTAELHIELIFSKKTPRTARKASLVSSSSSPAPVLPRTPAAAPWLVRQEPIAPLTSLHVPSEWGVCLWFTGLPCAGKSAVAEQLLVLLMEGGLRVTLLDGDTVRTHLSKGLSFSKEDRDTNVERIGFVASEIVRHRGMVICAAVSPYRETRERVRQMMPEGAFVEVFIDTPVEECERRDVKGFYAKARAGQISHFTGVNDPYEAPLQPEIALQTQQTTAHANAEELLRFLIGNSYLGAASEIRQNGALPRGGEKHSRNRGR